GRERGGDAEELPGVPATHRLSEASGLIMKSKRPPEQPPTAFLPTSSSGRTRTCNPSVNSRLLCRLSYRGSAHTLVLSHFEFEGFRTVMPALRLRSGQAPAGIQGEQAAASGYSAWIPAFAGMTQHSSPPQNHHDRLLGMLALRLGYLSKEQATPTLVLITEIGK